VCAAELRPRWLAGSDADTTSLDSLSLARKRESFDSAAAEAGFRKGQDGWVVLGRQDTERPAQESTSARRHLLRGDAEIGAFGSGDGYRGLEDNPRAVIGHGEVTLAFDGGPRTDLVLDEILRTLEWKSH